MLDENRTRQDARVNERRKTPRSFQKGTLVFVRKPSQSTGKIDSCMRGPYVVTKALPHGRYELKLIAGSYGKTTQAAAEHIVLWRGEWTPEVCSTFFEDDNDESGATDGSSCSHERQGVDIDAPRSATSSSKTQDLPQHSSCPDQPECEGAPLSGEAE